MSKRYSIFITALFCAFIGGVLLLNLLTPDREFSPMENRYLRMAPALTVEGVLSGKFMSTFETYVTDQFFARDAWVAAKARLEVLTGKGENKGVYICDKETLIPRFDPPEEKRVQNNLNYVNNLVDNVDIPVVFGLIPGKVSVWADRLPAGAPNASEGDILARAKASTAAQWADMEATMSAHAGEDIYYRLDHHWTSLGAYYGYAAVMEAMGLAPVALEEYEKTTVSTDFSGTTFSSSGVRWMTPDAIDLYVPQDDITVTSWFTAQPEAGALYHYDKLEEKDKYALFLGGNQAQTKIETAVENGEKLLVVRDSYADSMVPFLTPHFSEIHLLDPRYNKTPLSQYIEENGIDRVVVLYSVANFVTDSNLSVLGK